VREFHNFVASGVKFETTNTVSLLATLQARSSLVDNIKATQDKDPHLKRLLRISK
jgi:hypothetical protein